MKCFSTLTESGWKLIPVSVTALYTLDSLQLLSQIESAPSEGQAKKILIDAIINKIAGLMGTDSLCSEKSESARHGNVGWWVAPGPL